MWSFLTFIPNLITGAFTTINTVTTALSNEKIALINATTDRERAAIGERINSLTLQQQVLLASMAKSKVPVIVQVCMTAPIMILMAKIFLWDYMLGWGSTPNLLLPEWTLVYTVYGYWFVHWLTGAGK